MGLEYVQQTFGEGQVLCPMGGIAAPIGYSPQVDRHRAWVAVQDEVSGRYEHDENFELVGISDEDYDAEITRLAEERLGVALKRHKAEYMNLYQVSASSSYDARGRGKIFTSAYLQCPVCLFILPGVLA